MKKIIIARVRIKAGTEKQFLDGANAVVAATRKEPGCISYELLRDPTAPAEFQFVELWKSQIDIDAHFRAPHFIAFGDVLAQVAAVNPIITIYDIAAERVV